MTASVSPAQPKVKNEEEERQAAQGAPTSATKVTKPSFSSVFRVAGSTAYGRKWSEIQKTEDFEKLGELGILVQKFGEFFFDGREGFVLGENLDSARLTIILDRHSSQSFHIWLGKKGADKEKAEKTMIWHVVSQYTEKQLFQALLELECKQKGWSSDGIADLDFAVQVEVPKVVRTAKQTYDYLIARQLVVVLGLELSRWDKVNFNRFLNGQGGFLRDATKVREFLPDTASSKSDLTAQDIHHAATFRLYGPILVQLMGFGSFFGKIKEGLADLEKATTVAA